MPSQVQLNASAIGGLIQTANSGNIRVPANGIITVSSLDVASLLAAGCNYINKANRFQNMTPAPAAAAVGTIVASTSLANGTLSIAGQPDVGRLCSVRIDTGTSAITAGNVAFTYTANDGTTQVDNFSAIAVGTTVLSTNTSKGVLIASSVIVTALAHGAATPLIQVDTLAALALAVDPGFSSVTLEKFNLDGVNDIGTLNASAACVTPSTAPNGTHTYGAAYSYNAGNVA